MGKKKQETTSTATYGYMTPPKSPYFDAAEQMIGGYDGGASAVREGYARNVNQINEGSQSNSFYGGSTSPELKDMQRQSNLFRNNLELGRGLADAKQNEIAYKNAGYMSLGGATAPQLVQTGGSGTSIMHGSPLYDMSSNLFSNFGASAGAAAA